MFWYLARLRPLQRQIYLQDFYTCMAEIYSAKALFENETHFGVREKIRFNLAIDSFKASQEVGFFWNGKPPENIVYSHIDANDRFTEAEMTSG